MFCHLKVYALKNGVCASLVGGIFFLGAYIHMRVAVSFQLFCAFADLCDHALHISHDEL